MVFLKSKGLRFSLRDGLATLKAIGFIQLIGLLFFHIFAAGWFFIRYPDDSASWELYVECLYWVVTTVTTVGYGDITPVTAGEKIYTMLVMLFGVGLYGFAIGLITRTIADSEIIK